jgi:tetratricopeptide (TPR) repeat protein/serine phosphatase RsbU (regulator of sigma subunit)
MIYPVLQKLFLFILIVSFTRTYSQVHDTDSLKTALKEAKHDTTRCNIYYTWAGTLNLSNIDSAYLLWEKSRVIAEKNLSLPGQGKQLERFYNKLLPYLYNNIGSYYSDKSNYKTAKQYYTKALVLYKKNGDKAGAAEAYNNVGYINECLGETEQAFENYDKSLLIRESINDLKGTATTLNNIGYLFSMQGNQVKALDYFSKSLKIREQLKDKEGIAHSLNNIGSIYQEQGDAEKAMEYHKRALKLREEINDRQGITYSLINIAYLYGDAKKYDQSLACFEKSLKLSQQIGDKYTEAYTLNLMGNLYKNMGAHDKSYDYYTRGLKLFTELNNVMGMSTGYSNMGGYYEQRHEIPKAISYYEKSLELGKETGYPTYVLNAAENLFKIYKKQNMPAKALEMHLLYTQMKDSISNEKTRKASLKSQFQNEYDRKEIEIKAQSKMEKETIELKAAEEKKRQSMIIYFIAVGLVIVSLFSVFIFRGLQQNKKANKLILKQKEEVEQQKQIIEEKNHQVEEKQKEIIDSINYAKRIQRSLLPSDALLNGHLKDYFILFKPKDIVSGDFYWADSVLTIHDDGHPQKLFYLVTADSTGHGVPGAIMSMLNIACLNEAMSKGYTMPDEILFETRLRIIEHLKNDGSTDGGKDGMDCSLICFDFANRKMIYSAANNPVWIARSAAGVGLIELPADKMPVGRHDKDQLPFTRHTVELQKGDVVYAITDGMPDQFGGPKGKKFMYRQLKDLLMSIAGLPMKQQREELAQAVDLWKGELEQVDDITIIGIRV